MTFKEDLLTKLYKWKNLNVRKNCVLFFYTLVTESLLKYAC